MKLSGQSLGAIMMALQKSLLEQTDIVPVLLGFDFAVNTEGELFVQNAPTVDLSQSAEMDFSDLTAEEMEEFEGSEEV